MKREVTVEFDEVLHGGEFARYEGRICGEQEGEKLVDTVDALNMLPRYHISIRPMPGNSDWWQVITRGGLRNSGVRYRYGNLEEVKAIAEAWATRRFKIQAERVEA
ncbi:MAG: hypothetical protein ACO3VQ_05235 [Ilumatobacteraceae bacterium]